MSEEKIWLHKDSLLQTKFKYDEWLILPFEWVFVNMMHLVVEEEGQKYSLNYTDLPNVDTFSLQYHRSGIPLTRFRTCYPKIWHLGIVNIPSSKSEK